MFKTKALLKRISKFFRFLGGRLKDFFAALWALIKKHKFITAIICIIILLITVMTVGAYNAKKALESMNIEVKAEIRDIEEAISDDTVVEPNSEYSITANVTGEIISDTFEEGDTVRKDDIMYIIDSEAIENNIQSAEIAIAKAKKAYDDAVNENALTVRDTETSASNLESAKLAVQKAQQAYNDALKAKEDLTLKSNYTGYITEVYISEGDTIAAGTKIADILDNGTLKIKVPFNSVDADNIWVGAAAKLTLTKNGTVIDGVVTDVSSVTESGGGFTSYRKVTIEAQNPGAVTSGDTATAMVGSIACGDAGTFEYITEDSITASCGGKIDKLYISENSYVYDGTAIALLDSASVDSQITTARLTLEDAYQTLERTKIQQNTNESSIELTNEKLNSSVENAKLAYKDALLARDNLLKQLEDYTIKAPISGTVVTKNKKAGDNAGGTAASASSYASSDTTAAASAASTAMAVIYDMSKLKCTLNVDEIDIKNVSIGQKVIITTDVNDKEYTGQVETVSVNGTAGTNGVTTYPVKINIIDFDDDLLPGMNIEASIVISSVHDALAIPINALNRGNTVYVKGDKVLDDDDAPEGYKTVNVITGVSDEDYIQILSGLSEGDVVYTPEIEATNPYEMMQSSGGGM